MSFDEGSDYCRLRKFGETNGEQPVFALICDNDFPISYRERSCLNACKSHWDFSKGYVTIYSENPDRQAKITNENYIHGIVIDPSTFLKNFGKSRLAKANRLEKEAKMLVNQWNRLYGPNVKNESGVCMPKSVMFQLGKHTWTGRSAQLGYGEEKAYMLLEITTYGFAEALKERRFKNPNGENVTPKITLEDLDVYIKIASTKISKSKSDKSNSAASSNHTIVYDSLEGGSRMPKELLRPTSFDRWGFKMKLNPFLKMLASPFMAEVAEDCHKVLRCKGVDDQDASSETCHSASTPDHPAAAKGKRQPAAPKKRKAAPVKRSLAPKKPRQAGKKPAKGKREEEEEEEEEEIRPDDETEEVEVSLAEEGEEEEHFPESQELLEPEKPQKRKRQRNASLATRKRLNFAGREEEEEEDDEEYEPPQEEEYEESERESDLEFIDESDYDDDPIRDLNDEVTEVEPEEEVQALPKDKKKKPAGAKTASRGKR